MWADTGLQNNSSIFILSLNVKNSMYLLHVVAYWNEYKLQTMRYFLHQLKKVYIQMGDVVILVHRQPSTK